MTPGAANIGSDIDLALGPVPPYWRMSSDISHIFSGKEPPSFAASTRVNKKRLN